MRTLLIPALLLAFGCAKQENREPVRLSPGEARLQALAGSTRQWLASLDPGQLAQAQHSFEHAERSHWAFVPGERAGLRLSQMSESQRQGALDIARQLLTVEGMRQVEGVLELEALLGSNAPANYNAGWYDWIVFGAPGESAWGLRIEGHHLSMQWITDGKELSVTPWFVGVAPFKTRDGYAPLEVERSAALAWWSLLTEAEQRSARIAGEAPGDILGVPGADLATLRQCRGLSMDHMNPAAVEALWKLIEAYARRLRPEFADLELARMHAEPASAICMAWAGGTTADSRHYYCIRGSFFAIEFDCTAGPDHVHTAWHDFERNHGNALQKHLEQHPHGREQESR